MQMLQQSATAKLHLKFHKESYRSELFQYSSFHFSIALKTFLRKSFLLAFLFVQIEPKPAVNQNDEQLHGKKKFFPFFFIIKPSKESKQKQDEFKPRNSLTDCNFFL